MKLAPPTAMLVRDTGLLPIAEKVLGGERLTPADGLALFESPDVLGIGALANVVRERLHGDVSTFNRNQHINATNVCEATCIFCSFSRLKTGDPAGPNVARQLIVQRYIRVDYQHYNAIVLEPTARDVLKGDR